MSDHYAAAEVTPSVPGLTTLADRICCDGAGPTIDHREPRVARWVANVLDGIKAVFHKSGPSSLCGSAGCLGAASATPVPCDKVIASRNGEFAKLGAGGQGGR